MARFLTPVEIDRLESKKNDFLKKKKVNLKEARPLFTYHVTKLDGNTLSQSQVNSILSGKIIKHSTQVDDVINTAKCFDTISSYKGDLTKAFILKLHEQLFKEIDFIHAGKLRDHDVEIYGSRYMPPTWEMLDFDLDKLIDEYSEAKMHPFELAAVFHLKFSALHPFFDGNGRMSHLLMNLILIQNGFPPLVIDSKKKKEYFNVLEKCQVENTEAEFVEWLKK